MMGHKICFVTKKYPYKLSLLPFLIWSSLDVTAGLVRFVKMGTIIRINALFKSVDNFHHYSALAAALASPREC